jgi:hypothetical protein
LNVNYLARCNKTHATGAPISGHRTASATTTGNTTTLMVCGLAPLGARKPCDTGLVTKNKSLAKRDKSCTRGKATNE